MLLSCDWGTSTFRLRLIDRVSAAVLAEVRAGQGIAATFESWQRSGLPDHRRLIFYQAWLLEQIALLEKQPGVAAGSLHDLPMMISGMASSGLGMMELSYKTCPFRTDGGDLIREILPATSTFPHELTLISGVRTEKDVMRGEETLLVGAANAGHSCTEGIFIFPGTHSKQVRVTGTLAIDFKTFMTGEFFRLLQTNSILSASLPPAGSIAPDPLHTDSFDEGVADSRRSGILHNSFLVRTRHLLKGKSKEENYHYLSGLLIGAELNELDTAGQQVILVSSGNLGQAYERALTGYGITNAIALDADRALVTAHHGMAGRTF